MVNILSSPCITDFEITDTDFLYEMLRGSLGCCLQFKDMPIKGKYSFCCCCFVFKPVAEIDLMKSPFLT